MERKKHKHAYAEYNRARKMLNQGETELALISIRRCLESLVKQLCDSLSVSYNPREDTLETLINRLGKNGIINEEDRKTMHRIRSQSNKGSHVNFGKNVSAKNTEKILKDMRRLLSKFEGKNFRKRKKKGQFGKNLKNEILSLIIIAGVIIFGLAIIWLTVKMIFGM